MTSSQFSLIQMLEFGQLILDKLCIVRNDIIRKYNVQL